MRAAGRPQPRRDPVAEVAVVVGVEALGGQGAQGRGQRGEPDPLAGPPRAPLGPPDAAEPGRPRLPAQVRLRGLDGVHQPGPRREPGRRVLDRRRQHRVAREPAPAAVGVRPGADRARDRDGEGPAQRDPVEAPLAQRRGVHPGGRAPGAIEGDLLAGRLVPHQPERVAADPAAVGHDHAQHGVGGDGGVHGVPARRQHGQPGRRREVMRRHDRAAGAADQPGGNERRVRHGPRLPRRPPGARTGAAG